MNITNGIVPWNGEKAHTIDLTEILKKELGKHAPKMVTLYAVPSLEPGHITQLRDNIITQLKKEQQTLKVRTREFIQVTGIPEKTIENFLSRTTHHQPWALYDSEYGGLDIPETTEAERGIIPCSSMQNHGVAWKDTPSGRNLWLATARKPGQSWDYDSDIGHESAHTRYAPVPLYVQTVTDAKFSEIRNFKDITPNHLAHLNYHLSETVVVALRREKRNTPSGLPLPESREYEAMLKIADYLMPNQGYRKAVETFQDENGKITMDREAIHHITKPMITTLPHLDKHIANKTPPPIEEYQSFR